MICDEYSVNCEGEVEDDLLLLVKLLHSKSDKHGLIFSQFEDHGLELDELKDKEKLFLQRYCWCFDDQYLYIITIPPSHPCRLAGYCLEKFPGRHEVTLSCAVLPSFPMSSKEGHAHRLSSGQQHCLQMLLERLGRS